MKTVIIKEIFALLGLIGFIILLVMSFGIIPALGNFLNPFGVWTVPSNAEYPTSMVIRDSRLTGMVHVNIDKYGIPHIYAQTDKDLLFALGYLHARNRLFEMDMFRRYAGGKLSELLGSDYINVDKYMLTIGFNRRAQKELNYLKINETYYYNLIQSYCNGINLYISQNSPTNLPLEYYLISAAPQPWRPIDVVLAKYLQAWGLTATRYDLDFTLLHEKLPKSVFNELYPNWTTGLPFEEPIIPDGSKGFIENHNTIFTQAILNLLDYMEAIPPIFKSLGENGIGSNNWAVNGSKTSTGNPLLAGDPHLGHQIPSVWYEVHLISGEGYNTTGVTFPGIPYIIIGHNDHIAWSLTNVGGDSAVDWYNETSNGTHYYYNGKWQKFSEYHEIINVKSGSPISFTVRETVHGPVMTDLISHKYINENLGVCLTMKWSGTHTPLDGTYNIIKAIYGINKAKNWTEFNESLKYWDSPPQNFVYADDQGNIAMTVAGAHPIRKQGVLGTPNGTLTGRFVQPGNGTGEEWAGFIPYGKIPQSFNPKQCYLVSANQRSINESYQYYLGTNSWDPGYRAREINRVLRSKNNFTMDDFKKLQSDNYDYSASQFVPILIKVWNYSISKGDTYSADIQVAMSKIYQWNKSDNRFIMDRYLIAPTIYWKWIELYQQNTWSDEFTNWGAVGLKFPAISILENITKNDPNSVWFNDTSIHGTQDRNYTMLKTLNETVDWLKSNIGSNINKWTWGNVHKIYFEHLTGLKTLNRGPYSHDGSSWTPNNAYCQWDSDEKAYIAQLGPSWRMIIDLGNLTTQLTSIGVYPGGQNSNPVSKHYDDLLQLWLNYQYHNIYFKSQTGVVEATILFTR